MTDRSRLGVTITVSMLARQCGLSRSTLLYYERAILRLLEQSRTLRRTKMITKDKWVAIMHGAGFTEADMHRWHSEFEKSAPDEHQEFLEFLHIVPDEIEAIREASRKGARS